MGHRAVAVHLNFMRKNAWSSLHNKIDIAKSHILDLRLSRKQSNQRWGHFLAQSSDDVDASNQFHLLKNYLYSISLY